MLLSSEKLQKKVELSMEVNGAKTVRNFSPEKNYIRKILIKINKALTYETVLSMFSIVLQQSLVMELLCIVIFKYLYVVMKV